MVGVAVNVTLVPAQIAEDGLAAMLTLTGNEGFTDIVIVFDVAGFPVAHVAFDVKIHLTRSPLLNVELEYVAAFVPTFTPFTCHW